MAQVRRFAPSEQGSPVFGLETRKKPFHSALTSFGEVAEGPCGNKKKKGKDRMASDKQNLQDAFLNHVRKAKVPVTIFLINGVKLQGVITWFDNFCVLLRRDGQSQLVYKHAISTIMPGAPISLYEGEE